jgi:hypothetical protein
MIRSKQGVLWLYVELIQKYVYDMLIDVVKQKTPCKISFQKGMTYPSKIHPIKIAHVGSMF